MNGTRQSLVSVFLLILGLVPLLFGAERPRQSSEEDSILPFNFELIHSRQMILEDDPGPTGEEQRLLFSAWGRTFDLRLRPSRLFAAGATTVWLGSDGNNLEEAASGSFYEGRMEGDPESSVRLDLSGGSPQGAILTRDETFFLDRADDHRLNADPNSSILYRLSDMDTLWDGRECGAKEPASVAWESPIGEWNASTDASGSLPAAEYPDSLLEIELQIVVDSYYYARYGVNSAQRVHGLIHLVNGMFERELGVTFRVAGTHISLGRDQDTVGATTDPESLLDEFVAGRPQAGADLAHLFTGRELSGPTIGLSWTGSVCNTPYGSGLSQNLPNFGMQTVLTAHELGHNLGASHDGSGRCREVADGYVMWPVIDPDRSRFSECSRKSIQRSLEHASCLSPISPHPLPAPQPINPLTTVSYRELTFIWQPTDGADGYFLEILDEEGPLVLFSKKVLETFFHPDVSLRSGQAYSWRIAALDDSGLGERTAWQPFSVYASTWKRKPR